MYRRRILCTFCGPVDFYTALPSVLEEGGGDSSHITVGGWGGGAVQYLLYRTSAIK